MINGRVLGSRGIHWFAFRNRISSRLWYAGDVPAASQAQRGAVSNRLTIRHSGVVRLTHWLTFIVFLALLVSGLGIVISHPRFYWGEVGNVNTRPLFTLPIPASRDTVPTSYHYIVADMNGWGRYLHFEASWLLVLTGLLYLGYGIFSGHFRNNLIPARGERTLRACMERLAAYARFRFTLPKEGSSYTVLQRLVYLKVIFILVPMMIWTGLAMSPAFTSVFPVTAELLGGRQSARTLHFIITGLLVVFVVIHVTMVSISGFRSRMRAMITGYARSSGEDE